MVAKSYLASTFFRWIHPELAARGYNAASSLTRYVREGLELLPEFKTVKDSYRGKSLRKGAASATLYHERYSMADAILLGRWKLFAFNRIYDYISVYPGPITYAGRVPGMNVDDILWPMAYLLIAIFLKDMDHVITAFGDNHIVIKKVYGWVKADLNKWSIREKGD